MLVTPNFVGTRNTTKIPIALIHIIYMESEEIKKCTKQRSVNKVSFPENTWVIVLVLCAVVLFSWMWESISTGRCRVASTHFLNIILFHTYANALSLSQFSWCFSLHSAPNSGEVRFVIATTRYTNMRTSCTIHIVSKVNERPSE